MKKLICFSLWGDNPTYTIGAIKNADLVVMLHQGTLCEMGTHEELMNKLGR